MSLLALALLAANAPLTVEVAGVRNARGHVRIDVCPQAKFLDDGCQWHASVPSHAGTTALTIEDLPPGDYAIQAFHDENNNDEMDRGLFGIPKEGFGFSRDARIVFSPPKWKDAAFTHGATPQKQVLHLRYWGH
ncbi:MAG: DUF2141 domain-containing protein [Sphingomonadales bacterium]|nr:DUF2141 domain-containing protein [Sphingomonadales bacterium]